MAEAQGRVMIAVRRLQGRKKYLTFVLGDKEYGFDVRHVQGIIPLQRIDPIPDAPQHCRGVTTVHGRMVAIFSARMKLGMNEGRDELWTSIILIDLAEDIWVGWVVDRVRDILDINSGEIEPPPPASGEGGEVFGLVRRGNRATILLDAGGLLGSLPLIA